MTLHNQLKNETETYIRFELGSMDWIDPTYKACAYSRAAEIADNLFDAEDTMQVTACLMKRKNRKAGIGRFLANHRLLNNMTIGESEDVGERIYTVTGKKTDFRLAYILKSLINKDFGDKPMVYGELHLVNVTKGILFHVYDDRGCDVKSLSKETLLPVYKTFRSWILDYNRIEIDGLFDRGLAGIKETKAERIARIEYDEKQIQEMQINLYKNNTSVITHQVRVPAQAARGFLEEVRYTGFSVSVKEETSENVLVELVKTEAHALIDYQSELMALYAKKYSGNYAGWSAVRASL